MAAYIGLTFNALRGANTARLPEFKNQLGEPAHSMPDGSDWTPAQWLQALLGEIGEYAQAREDYEHGRISHEEFAKIAAKEPGQSSMLPENFRRIQVFKETPIRKAVSCAFLAMLITACGGGNSSPSPAPSCADMPPPVHESVPSSQSGPLTDGMFRTDYAQPVVVVKCH